MIPVPLILLAAGVGLIIAAMSDEPTNTEGPNQDPPLPPDQSNGEGETENSSDPELELDTSLGLNLPRTGRYDDFLTAYASTPYHSFIASSESGNGIPENLYARLLYTESRFKPDAVSNAGAQGIAQFMPATANELRIDPLNPDEAIPAGAQYLSWLQSQLGDWKSALAAYNWGIGNLQKYGLDRAPRSVIAYADEILADSELNA